ncbi:bifunctional [glutamine synthetase] adenylyltransferase/[glutamine synthetase]-adenylyl-L-tyrosine phosphorylase [Agromyces seonyuensis]|uniref:Bifunctional [glutamine synthetase] adenylyltransferase/[glutamine synthetase]-adenylyl-L-tyrosine phosphorylase n=1 Tax=Agromyces seonyuensis TaxID=2662446 RepID=A0A6I4NX55_9MICO|nr:bifunctional [glutamine synthetase] adenylyltransferase/[glutamine synthetase]-adenylyl-L-tyrosine phosphorylase [Agromyces seonyuensis]MWB97085.1 bifunctional [glutamine synthetase] adenylyltransferase/[glutamine synthetase]-adenylyl-L-tyrosine phosphorylase [Agromyces seonyuensis]
MPRSPLGLTASARAGFDDLGAATAGVEALAAASGVAPPALLDAFALAADPDAALASVTELRRRAPDSVDRLLAEPQSAARLSRLVGASRGLADFLGRETAALERLTAPPRPPADAEAARATLVAAVESAPADADVDDLARRLRRAYRSELVELAVWDLGGDAVPILDRVAAGLADLAAAALDAALAGARRLISNAPGATAAFGRYPAEQVDAVRLAIIGMGKAGARELNYVSDVDVIYVGDSADEEILPTARALEIATRLAVTVQRLIGEPGIEPPLWEVDPNLRPEGKDGALVRTLDSHLQYYERWAKNWEFQALLKARAMAGDRELGERYVAGVAPKVWTSSSRDGFVEEVQRMRERVTANIPAAEVDRQLKLGPGGLRDIEFTVQLLQLVHGATDEGIRQRDTLGALAALAERGYVGREEAAEFADDYRVLRVLEHRQQLRRLRRTHLMPTEPADLRVLARASGLARGADELVTRWHEMRARVRRLHERLFYRPLLSAVAAIPASGLELTDAQAEARLRAIGYRDPRGALAHIAALTAGVSRRAVIQRHLMPVLIAWFADGPDPDYGMLAFRRISDRLGTTHWYLGLLRDSSEAALRLTRVLSSSRFAGELIEYLPEAVAWLEDDADLRPRSLAALQEEGAAVLARHADRDAAANVLRGIRRREILRLAIASILGTVRIDELGRGLSDVMEHHLGALLEIIRRDDRDGLEFGIVAMGRFGGRELGFGSDADLIYVFRPAGDEPERAQRRAVAIVAELGRLVEDARLPLELDADLRPEGRNGVVARSLDAYRAYYARWSLTWEAQALLRAHPLAGDAGLLADFAALADEIRYPDAVTEHDVREVKRIKARVENERLPQGADPKRHLKLGRGSLSDVEWFVQLLQLEHAGRVRSLRTTSTIEALDAAVDAGLVAKHDAATLRAAWEFASRARSALTLWLDRTTDVLPTDRTQLEGVARLLEYPPRSATRFEEDYLQTTRRARTVFERGFYGEPERREPRF